MFMFQQYTFRQLVFEICSLWLVKTLLLFYLSMKLTPSAENVEAESVAVKVSFISSFLVPQSLKFLNFTNEFLNSKLKSS